MILLDTHAWIWWVTRDPALSARARRAIDADEERAVSPLSCYEVARLAERGRIRFDRDGSAWIGAALRQDGILVVDVTPPIAVRAARFGAEFHGDPIGRMLAATALELGCALVTKDGRLRRVPALRTIW